MENNSKNLKTKENAKLLIIFSAILLGIDVIYIICGSLVPVFGLLLAIASIVFFILTVVYGFKTGSRGLSKNEITTRKLSISLVALFIISFVLAIVAIAMFLSRAAKTAIAIYGLSVIANLAQLGVLIALLCFAVKTYNSKNNSHPTQQQNLRQ
ncbi:Got1/Sft2-like family vesicle transport protein [Metamycoplasma hominis]|uniref:hypothetical protein n=1 Tax=Metamycoplasma hominis TaxID=2098 RepID=UPI002735A1C3|nr:hypothetical protein [Metamycoplasma hominis]